MSALRSAAPLRQSEQMGLKLVLSEIEQAAAAVGRDRQVQLLAVTKGRSSAQIQALLGEWRQTPYPPIQWPLAENRGQELRDKTLELGSEAAIAWHFIGPLQRNKIKYLKGVSLIHTVEAAWQLTALAQAGEQWGRVPDVLLQVHNGEAQKHGALPAEVAGLYDAAVQCGVKVRGLMVMAPYDDPKRAEQVFAQTAARAHDLGLSELSMGMSDDFKLAIEHGSTLVRIGRRLFE